MGTGEGQKAITHLLQTMLHFLTALRGGDGNIVCVECPMRHIRLQNGKAEGAGGSFQIIS